MLRRLWLKRKNPVEYESSSESENGEEVNKVNELERVDQQPLPDEAMLTDRVARGHAEMEILLNSSLSASTLKEYKVFIKR